MDTKDEVSFLVEEWKKNIDLHIHHDNLKQQRFRHFITIQAFLFTVFGLAIREYVDRKSIFLGLLAMLAPVLAIILCWTSLVLDQRAQAYSTAVKRTLRYIEGKIWHKSGLNLFETYAIQYHSLYTDQIHLCNDLDAKGLPKLVANQNPHPPATASSYEQWMIKMFFLFWMVAGCLAVAAFCFFSGPYALSAFCKLA